MNVESLMTKNVQTCRTTDRLDRAARVMWEADVGSVPVLDEASRVVGMITDRDVCMASYTQGVALAAIPVTTAMARTVVTCKPTDSVADAARLLQKHRIHRLPVLDGIGRLAGIVSVNDLARLAMRERSKPASELGTHEITELLASICEPRWVRTPPAHESPAPAPAVRKSGPASAPSPRSSEVAGKKIVMP